MGSSFDRPLLMGLNSLRPIIAAVAVDRTGSYTAACLGFAAINVLIALLGLVARPPSRRSALSTQKAAG